MTREATSLLKISPSYIISEVKATKNSSEKKTYVSDDGC